jgi:hypothetical protein
MFAISYSLFVEAEYVFIFDMCRTGGIVTCKIHELRVHSFDYTVMSRFDMRSMLGWRGLSFVNVSVDIYLR